jgi:hypothetical protein
VAENGTNFIVDVAQTADEEGHIIMSFSVQVWRPNAAKYSFVFYNLNL